jgi:hypothetical protein
LTAIFPEDRQGKEPKDLNNFVQGPSPFVQLLGAFSINDARRDRMPGRDQSRRCPRLPGHTEQPRNAHRERRVCPSGYDGPGTGTRSQIRATPVRSISEVGKVERGRAIETEIKLKKSNNERACRKFGK